MRYQRKPEYQRKPVEAEQFFEARHPWPAGVEPARLQRNRAGDRNYWPAGAPVLRTPDGVFRVQDGDWILTSLETGGQDLCSPGAFMHLYEPVAEAAPANGGPRVPAGSQPARRT